MPKQEVYHSSTLGPIPLSFTGRRLMQNLREAFQDLLQKRVEQTKRGQVGGQDDWTSVSEARGKLAQYMSKLEQRPPQSMPQGPVHPMWTMPSRCKPAAMVLDYVPKTAAELETLRQENEALKQQNQRLRESNSRALCELGVLQKEGQKLKEEAERLKDSQSVTALQLPPIPKGYELSVVGSIVSIAPVGKVKPIRGKKHAS